jgi:PTH1 family peptidyl-tRNA hydrolase
MYVIAGLGNPGKQYENTKHNIGFITIDVLAGRHNIPVNKSKHKALVGEGMIGGKKVMLVKPQTFMNDSGQSLRDIVHYFDIAIEELIVIYDDVDLPVGTVRIRAKGSSGTHNGMRDIIYQLQEDGFPRIRIGIGADRGEIPLYNWVLSGFSKEHIDPVREAVLRAADAVELFVAEDITAAMNQCSK